MPGRLDHRTRIEPTEAIVSEIASASPLPRRIPLALKVALTAFVAVQIVFYWSAYGPTNFLYFCDVALFLALISVLTEKRLPASMAAVGILIPQLLWVIDLICGMFGYCPIGMTEYMFRDPLPARAVSLFHGWLPFLLLYLVYRLGYDRRALLAWTVTAWGLMLIAYFLLPAPPAPKGSTAPVNVNFVYGLSDKQPQTCMPPLAWLAVMMTGLPVLFFIPTHLLLQRGMEPAGFRLGGLRPIPVVVPVEDLDNPSIPAPQLENGIRAVE